uniref:Uncharacterized protein n=1 Tax=viral metagenome TaxID=1070528 RepID=A0A6C0KY84_9ZZZZ
MSLIKIGNDTLLDYKTVTLLNYKIYENKYIITYVEEYNEALNIYLYNIFQHLEFYYQIGKLSYSNVASDNAKFICENLKINGVTTLGQIIISDGVIKNDEIKTIESIYGNICLTIGASYHALAYLKVSIEETEYYVAIETTICDPRYRLQFYVGSNENELENIIKIRYQSNNVRISSEFDKNWYDGGKNEKTKTKKTKTKKTKTKKTKTKKTKTKKTKTKKTKTKKRKQKWAF